MPKLGVNIDHIATLREARRGSEPEPVFAAMICEASGADSIVVHLREDRRHIKERDVFMLRHVVRTKLNLEMSVSPEIVDIACSVKPDQATLVPEKRQELTTEGGLDVVSNIAKVRSAARKLENSGVQVSLFIDPSKKQIDATVKAGVGLIELHTGRYADAKSPEAQRKYLKELAASVEYARKLGLSVFAGHGLNYLNVGRIARIKGIEELNIGHSVICRAAFVGLGRAVKEMRALVK